MRHIDHQLRAYLDRELSPAEQRAAGAHLAKCPACTAKLDALRRQAANVAAPLSTTAPAVTPDAQAALVRFHAAQPAGRNPVSAVNRISGENWFTRSFNMLHGRLLSPRLRPVMIGLTAVVCLALLFTIVPVREAAADFLGLFRVRKFAVIPINPDQAQRLEGLARDAENVLGEPTVTRPEGERQAVSDAAQASALAGFTVRTPSVLPEGAVLKEFTVQAGPAAHYEVQRSTVETLLQAAGASTAGLPQADVLAADVDMGPGVAQHYSSGLAEINLFQTPHPNVNLPEGLDMVTLSETGFQLLGIAPDEARRLATTIDWTSTAVIPMPTDIAQANEVTIDGSNALLIERAQNARSGNSSELTLLWERDNILYALNTRNIDRATLLSIADSLQ
jgi:hypothetical protein